METIEKKKLSPNDTIIMMLHYINNDKKDLFYQAAEEYYKTLSKSGDISYRIKKLLNEKPLKIVQLSDLSNDIKKIIIQNPVKEEAVYLNERTKSFIDELLMEWNNSETYRFHNLGVRNKILLHGLTGNGKTTIARHISKLSGLPFVEVNADMMIDSKLGNTNYNIHKLLNDIKMPCILFWDEVDTIGRARGKGNDTAAGLENERMVNSILVNIERLANDVIFIGATNRRDVLDSAFLRRFDVQFEVSEPTEYEKKMFVKQLSNFYKIPAELIPEEYINFSNYSDIKLLFVEVARKYILKILSNHHH